MLRTTVGILALVLPGSAMAWPGSGDWEALTLSGADLADDVGDSSGKDDSTDLLGQAGDAAGAWFVDEDTLYLRSQVVDAPGPTLGLFNGHYACWVFDADGDATDWEFLACVEGSYARVSLYENDGTSGLDFSGAQTLGEIGDYDSGNVDVSTNSGTYFFDIEVPRSELEDTLGLAANTELRVAVFTAAIIGSGYSIVYDVAGCGGDSCNLDDVLSDSFAIDGDVDGGSDSEVDSDSGSEDSGDDIALDDAEGDDVNVDGPNGRWVPRSCNAMGNTSPLFALVLLVSVGLRRRS